MNKKIIRYILSKILYIEAGFLLLPIIVSLIYKEDISNILSFLATIILLLLSGYVIGHKADGSGAFYEKEGFVIVALLGYSYLLSVLYHLFFRVRYQVL